MGLAAGVSYSAAQKAEAGDRKQRRHIFTGASRATSPAPSFNVR